MSRGPKTGPTAKRPPKGMSRAAYERQQESERGTLDRMLRSGGFGGTKEVVEQIVSAKTAERSMIRKLKTQAADLRGGHRRRAG